MEIIIKKYINNTQRDDRKNNIFVELKFNDFICKCNGQCQRITVFEITFMSWPKRSIETKYLYYYPFVSSLLFYHENLKLFIS